jgi:hypothetical protein
VKRFKEKLGEGDEGDARKRIWKLRGVSGNVEQVICPICNAEEDSNHIY